MGDESALDDLLAECIVNQHDLDVRSSGFADRRLQSDALRNWETALTKEQRDLLRAAQQKHTFIWKFKGREYRAVYQDVSALSRDGAWQLQFLRVEGVPTQYGNHVASRILWQQILRMMWEGSSWSR